MRPGRSECSRCIVLTLCILVDKYDTYTEARRLDVLKVSADVRLGAFSW